MEIMRLKNGAEEPNLIVIATMQSLEHLVQTNPIATYELVEVCKNPLHEPFGNAEEILTKLSLIENGSVHDSIRNIVLSAFEGEGFEMQLTSPVSKSPTPL